MLPRSVSCPFTIGAPGAWPRQHGDGRRALDEAARARYGRSNRSAMSRPIVSQGSACAVLEDGEIVAELADNRREEDRQQTQALGNVGLESALCPSVVRRPAGFETASGWVGAVNAVIDDRLNYDALYRMHHPRVLRLCQRLLADPDEAHDVTQEVFLKLHEAVQQSDRQIAWAPWLTRVAVNACHDRRRSGWWKWWRREHQEFVEAQVPARDPNPEDQAISNQTRRHVWGALRDLSARQREVFVLRHLEGWSTEEVADKLGLSPGSVKRHLYRAVHSLRSILRGRR
jgi:RNA polymerase sigma-70 factor (ECF subfamily)